MWTGACKLCIYCYRFYESVLMVCTLLMCTPQKTSHSVSMSFATDKSVRWLRESSFRSILQLQLKSYNSVYSLQHILSLFWSRLPHLSMQLPRHPSTWPSLLGVCSMTALCLLGFPLSTPMVLCSSISCSCHFLEGKSSSTQQTTPPWQCCLTWPLVPSTISQWGPSLWPLDHSVLSSSYTLLTVRIHAAQFVTGESALLYDKVL